MPVAYARKMEMTMEHGKGEHRWWIRSAYIEERESDVYIALRYCAYNIMYVGICYNEVAVHLRE